MMTSDKDYGQLAEESVFIYRPKYGNNDYEILNDQKVMEKYNISHPHQMIDLLGLMGDSSDNIPGCPGVGEKTAIKLLDEFGDIDTLLANTDKIKGALREKIENNREMILLSRTLATIKTDVPVELNMESLKLTAPDESGLTALFESLEFRALLSRFRSKAISQIGG